MLDLTDSGHGLLLGYTVNRCHHQNWHTKPCSCLIWL